MIKTGKLTIQAGVSQLNQERLAVISLTNSIAEATEVLKQLGLSSGDEVAVEGIEGRVNNNPVFLMTGVVHVSATTAAWLGGGSVLPPANVKCKQCSHVNQIIFLDLDNLPDCQNSPPTHTLAL